MKNLVQMRRFGGRASSRAVLVAALMLATLISGGWAAGAAGSNGDMTGGASNPLSPAVTCPRGQCFTDVPPSSPFFDYINNLYLDGVISGYACGGAGEPCDDQNRAYYRPGANVSRGQMSKFEDLGRRKVTGVYTATGNLHGIFTAINNNRASSYNAGVYAEGATAVWGESTSTGGSDGYSGYFFNNGGGTGVQTGVFGGVNSSTGSMTTAGFFENIGPSSVANSIGVRAYTTFGYGVHGESSGSTGILQSIGVVGISNAAIDGAGGVFTATQTNGAGVVARGGPYASGGSILSGTGVSGFGGYGSAGVYGQDGEAGGYGVEGDARRFPGNGETSAVGLFGHSYDDTSSHIGLRVRGSGLASGGFSTGLGYSMLVKYNGKEELQTGSVLALDGNNALVGDTEVLGTTAATADNAGATVGVAQYRYTVFPSTPTATDPTGSDVRVQVDTSTTKIQPGDLVQVVVVGQAKVRVSGAVGVGDQLIVSSTGAVVRAEEGATHVIGKVAGKPDKDGYVTVLIK